MRWRNWRLLILRKKRFTHNHCLLQQVHESHSLTVFNLQMDEVVREMERKCDQKLAECKEESRLHLTDIQEEHTNLVVIKIMPN